MKKITVLLFILFLSVGYAQLDQFNTTPQKNIEPANLISVTIGGKFVVTGTFAASFGERVDQFITRIFNAAAKEREKPNFSLNDYSFRDLILKHYDGKEEKIDLVKFHTNGDFANNPYLKNDDVIIFQAADVERNFFSVTGAVNNPARFNFVDGDNLQEAIQFSGGINKAYDNVTKVEINRLSYDGRKEQVITADINSNIPLERGDRIVVVAIETQKKAFYARILGEVHNPGWVPITKDRTTLYDFIKKAGGLTTAANLLGGKLYTGTALYPVIEKQFNNRETIIPYKLDLEMVQNLTILDELKMARMSYLVPEDTAYFKLENKIRTMTEHAAIDFRQLEDSNSEASKYIVKDNDLVVIPAIDNTIYLFGQVLLQGHIPYVQGKGYEYYVQKAGGLGEYAQKSEIMIIKGYSDEWIPAEKNPVIEQGDYIYVPRTPARSINSYVAQIGTYLGIIGSAATIILLLIQLNKL